MGEEWKIKGQTVTICLWWSEELNTCTPFPSSVILRMYLKITYSVICKYIADILNLIRVKIQLTENVYCKKVMTRWNKVEIQTEEKTIFKNVKCFQLIWIVIVIFQELQNSTASEGQVVVLECRVRGPPPIHVKWFRQGVEIQDSPDFRILQKSKAIIWIGYFWYRVGKDHEISLSGLSFG